MESAPVQKNTPEGVVGPASTGGATHDPLNGGMGVASSGQGWSNNDASDNWLPKLDVEGSSPFARSNAVISHEPNEVYHQRPEFSCSQIKVFCDDVLEFHGRYVARSAPPKKSTALDYGTKVHLRAEIGEQAWAARKRVAPSTVLTSAGLPNKDWDTWVQDVASSDGDAVPLTPAEDAQLDAQFAGIFRNPKAKELLTDTIDREFAVSWNWEGHPVRCRCDGATAYAWYDLKTCRQQRPMAEWWKSVDTYRYHYQAAIYEEGALQAGWPPHELIFIVTSTVWPYACHCVTLPRPLVTRGRLEVLAALAELSQRIAFDHWTPDDYGSVSELPCPQWMKEFRYGG